MVLQTQRLIAGYPDRSLYGPLDWSLRPGELTAFVGPNGAGKTTVLKTLAGLQPALGGRVLAGDEEVSALSVGLRAERISMVLTRPRIPGMITVDELIALGRGPHTGLWGKMTDRDRALCDEAAMRFEVDAWGSRRAAELSDGEQQRVLLARADAQDTPILLLDEPGAFLDAAMRIDLMDRLRTLTREKERTVVLTTHDWDGALEFCDRVFFFGPDRTIFSGAPEDGILAGELHRIFSRGKVAFDSRRGVFRTRRDGGPKVRILGEGESLRWTRRALRRRGFQPVDGTDETAGADLFVEIRSGERLSWNWLRIETEERGTAESLYDLCRALSESNESRTQNGFR